MSGDDLEVTQLVGSAWNGEVSSEAKGSWSQVRVVAPLSDIERQQTGSMLLLTHFKDKPDSDEKGIELIEELVSRFQKEVGFPRSEWIKRTKDFLDQKLMDGESVAIAVIWTNPEGKRAIYITGVGGGLKVKLERAGQENTIWPTGGGWLSGWLKDDDVVVMGTDKFWSDAWVPTVRLEERIEAAREKMAEDESGEMASIIAKVVEEKVVESAAAWPREKEFVSELKPVENLRRKWLFRMGAVFLIMLLLSVGVGMWRRDKLDKQKQYDSTAQPIKDQLAEAQQIWEVNPIRARDLMTKAKQTIESTNTFGTGEFADDWRVLSQRVDEEWQLVSGEKQIEAKNWLDLSVIKEGMRADRMSIDGVWLEILDKQNRLLGAVKLADKTSQQMLAGSNLSGVVDMSGGVVLTDKGLIRLNPEKKTTANIFEQMDELGSVSHLSGFGGNVYTADSTDLWKFPITDAGLGGRRRYFGVGVTPDMTTVTDMWVDGDVWLVTADGKLTRYSKGAKVPFSLTGWSNEWGSVSRVKTTENELFIWDKQNGLVAVFDRESGDFKRKLINDNLKSASDVVIDEEGQRLILGVGGKLVEMNLN